MAIDIRVVGFGLAAVLGAGSLILAIMNNPVWAVFLVAAILVFALPIVLREL